MTSSSGTSKRPKSMASSLQCFSNSLQPSHYTVKCEPSQYLGNDVTEVDLEDGSFDMIDLFREHPCLYNTNLRDYRDKDKKAAAIADIAARVGRSENAVRKKIKVLRTIYTRYKKEKILRNGEAPCWKNAERLSFLDEFSTPRLDLMDTMTDEFMGEAYVDDCAEDDVVTADWLAVSDGDDDLHVLSVQSGSSKRARYSTASGNSVSGEAQGNGHGSSNGNSQWMAQSSASASRSLMTLEHQQDFSPPSALDDTGRYHHGGDSALLPYSLKAGVELPTFVSSSSAASKGTSHSNSSSRAARPLPVASSANANNGGATSAAHRSTSNSSTPLSSSLSQCQAIFNSEDTDDVFGRYVGLELRSITDLNAKRLAKLRIQTILYEAQTGFSGK